ncbi:hypothetical protein LIPSTDRAFT_336373, partial [Lipomyces starkeyi NRRL Y-11557]
ATQTLALTKITASAWECSFTRAREVYTKVVRSALTFGATAWHTPGDKPRGLARELALSKHAV